jgi:hypothetical protein
MSLGAKDQFLAACDDLWKVFLVLLLGLYPIGFLLGKFFDNNPVAYGMLESVLLYCILGLAAAGIITFNLAEYVE